MMQLPLIHFPAAHANLLQQLQQLDATAYGQTRNFTDGAVSYLSPYIARGVIGLPAVAQNVLSRYSKAQAIHFIRELAWREYYQRVWQQQREAIFTDLRCPQQGVAHYHLPLALQAASTGIEAVDEGIRYLYQYGYLHNHLRMYTAMLACNIGRYHWLQPARWMYYHLLDGDLASNMLSWQWVAGSFSHKKYVANQQNINQFTHTRQTGTFLDTSYENLEQLPIPVALANATEELPITHLPAVPDPVWQAGQPLLVYNSYQLDPLWHAGQTVNRVLLLEPAHFAQYPVSNRVLHFVMELATVNIPGIQVFTGSFDQLLQQYRASNADGPVYFKEHPTTGHYTGTRENREWLFPSVEAYYPSFSAYWKKCEPFFLQWI